MALTGTDRAYTQARSGMLRSGAGRAGWFVVYNLLVTIIRNELDGEGNIVDQQRIDVSPSIVFGSVQITKGLNDAPDTASFTLQPLAASGGVVPQSGEVIEIALGSASNLMFAGQAMKILTRYQPGIAEPWYDVFCVDWLDLFDARLVTMEYTSESATTILTDLLRRYTWHWTGGQVFTAAFQPGMPLIASLPITNQRLSTVFRTVTAQVGGGFYIEPNRIVRAWAAGVEPVYPQPQSLTMSLRTLKRAAITDDATQVRTAILVEGKRTTTALGIPAGGAGPSVQELYSIPVDESAFFVEEPIVNKWREIRIGTQWAGFKRKDAIDPTLNPPGSTVTTAATPGATRLYVADLTPFDIGNTEHQWITVGGQQIRYHGGNVGGFLDQIPATGYGSIQAPISVGSEVTRIPFLADVDVWTDERFAGLPYRSQTPGQAVVSMYREDRPSAFVAWNKRCYLSDGRREQFVQDGRWSYAGMQARADVELDMFETPLLTLDWETSDMNADVGRLQQTALPDSSATCLVTQVAITFPIPRGVPRRVCHGVERSRSQAATLLDVILTEPN
jgi:hypothetical protein